MQSVSLAEIFESLLDHALGLAIGANRYAGSQLDDRFASALPINRRRRRKYERLNVVLDHRIEQLQSLGDVVDVIFGWQGPGFADLDKGAEMHDGIDPVFLENLA